MILSQSGGTFRADGQPVDAAGAVDATRPRALFFSRIVADVRVELFPSTNVLERHGLARPGPTLECGLTLPTMRVENLRRLCDQRGQEDDVIACIAGPGDLPGDFRTT